MKTPRYTDMYRYPYGYTRAVATNIGKTAAREYARLKAMDEARKLEVVAKVRQIKVAK